MPVKAIEWLGDKVRILDQTRLPHEEVYLELSYYQDIASAITELKIRGAPAIGVAAAYGVALGALEIKAKSRDDFLEKLRGVSQTLADTRPTARNMFRAIDRMQQLAQAGENIEQIKTALVNEAIKIHNEEAEATRKLSQLGAELIEDSSTILTHCNTGALATAGYGTALGVIKQAREQGKKLKVLATETRPLLQGARITAWELKKAGIPFALITDSMAGYFISRGEVNCVIVGADRIAANGDTANKIGTYTLAVLAKEHGIPFYVAAPTTTIDLSLASGTQIPIEQRSPEEVTHIQGISIAPEGIEAANPAFDITPHRYITAIITENGIIREPYIERLKRSNPQ
ncbi:MAG: S-methyl-5-thioribose-1-phosphate isomerase [Dehalococcoidales bacterium]|nr:S-methyl-5-thioribose-1-phosphate isomerase [Dehalococcoidales bacterium]